MTRKTADCYSALFKFIEKKLFKLRPTEMMTDFEEGMRLAIRKYWPNVILRGCWFHYCRAIMRKSKNLGMKKFMRNSKKSKAIRKALMNLPLLPAEKIRRGFDFIVQYARKRRLFKRFSRLFTYVRTYWLEYQV